MKFVDEVKVWLAGEFSDRLPAEAIDRVVRRTRADLADSIAPEEMVDMLHRLGRARLQRIVQTPRIPQAR